ncbi:MAG: ABC transporter ATP-binding protein [Acidobacteriota bacterium]|nr:ABC transporter ATP-binding protein [Acidobacteriota bacterium]MDH3524770.1 ABC transporter ATP-binding protein [Acidobacteriota bacterium]
MIEVQNLTRRYGDFTAVDSISFAVDDGEIVGMLGPNGAGKTTAIRMITGFLPPTSGRVRVSGRNLFEDPVEARRDVGYLPENVALYPEMRVSEYLAYRARLEGMTGAAARTAIREVLADCLIESVARQVIGTLSKGYRQRVGLAAAILHQPKVLVLDEPTVGLDPKQIIAIRELIRTLGGRRTLLLSTHILPEVELLCDRVVIIDRGRVVAEGTPDSLRRSWQGEAVVTLELKEGRAEAAELLAAVAGVAAVEAHGDREFELRCRPGSDPREELFRLAVDRRWTLLELAQRKASLEDIFVRLTTDDAGAAAAGAVEPAAAGEAGEVEN